VRETGLPLSEDSYGVYVHGERVSSHVHAPAVRWSGRTTWRAHASRLAARWQWHRGDRAGLVRLALHPQDLGHVVTATSALQALQQVPARGVPAPYTMLHA
jgi:hypothetical protein